MRSIFYVMQSNWIISINCTKVGSKVLGICTAVDIKKVSDIISSSVQLMALYMLYGITEKLK